MLGGRPKVLVGGQQYQVVPPAKLDEQGVDRADLNSTASAGVRNLRCLDVVLPVGLEKSKDGEAFYKLVPSLRPGETL